MTIRLIVIEDHEVVRSGLVAQVADTEVEIVAEGERGDEALPLVLEHRPDVVLLDIRLPVVDGLDALEQIKETVPDTPVLMFSAYDNPTYIARAMARGASGFVLKGSRQQEILDAIRSVTNGRQAWTAQELRRVAATPKPVNGSHYPTAEAALTQRETEVLQKLALGLSNKEIARTLHISVETVKEHVHHILEKLAVSGRTQAAVWAVRNNLI